MIPPDRMAQVLRTGAAAAALLVLTCGSVGPTSAQGSRPAAKGPAASGSAAPNAVKQRDQELDSVKAEQRKASETEQRLTTENNAIADDRRRLNQSLIAAASRIRTTEERVAAMEIHLRQLESSEADIRKSLEGRRAQIGEILAALQRFGHRPPPALFVRAQDAIETLRTAMALEAVLPQMRSEANKLQAELADLARVKAAKEAEHSQLARELTELSIMQKSMESLIEERQTRQAEIEEAIAAERQRTLTLSRQADNLKDLIGKLEPAGDATKRAARAPTRSGEDSKASNTARSGLAALNDPNRMGPAVAFVSAKGRLSLPVSGVKIREFGAPDGAGGTEKGISIETRPGAQVTAPSDGWVVYAAPYRSYGQLLILNVGGGYHILLAGMERITVDPGQFVLTGEPVAVMGNGTRVASVSSTGSSSPIGSPEPVLYIEFRKDGTPVDSSPWWAATVNEKVRG